MSLVMAGIDWSQADLGVRERFSFTDTTLGQALSAIADVRGVSGCAILATCNRTELYVSATRAAPTPRDLLCRALSLDSDAYGGYVVDRAYTRTT